ncbi:glycoside hydrolase [Cladorrhinum sp. PSN259]|nr:glycoside hydrolase [Cladorrhinum sp. PSN259]
MTRPHKLILALSSALLTLAQSNNNSNKTQQGGLHSLFVAAGKQYFGTATETNNLNDAPYQAIVNDVVEFGQLTPENSQKWEVTQPLPNQFSFNQSDLISAKAKSNKQLLRCHTLTWHSQLPPFVSSTAWTPATLRLLLQTHLTNLMTHFRGACFAWDVVNEALTEEGTYRPSIFFQILGESYIPLSFSIAANASASDPLRPKLYYNDFNLETNPKKLSGAVRIVQLLQSTKTKIDGLGFQAHLAVGKTPSRQSLTETLQKFTSLGLEVALTELDIAHPSLPPADADREQQADDYVSAVGACLDVEKCVGVTLWQFTDKYSWIPSIFPGTGDACLWTADYQKKPAYFAVRKLLEDATSAAASNSTTTATKTGAGTPGAGVTALGEGPDPSSTATSAADSDVSILRFYTIISVVMGTILFVL